MCTVTVIRTARGFRLVHSRDEQRTRTPGEPGAWRETPSGRVWSPRDPDAGGTWLGAHELGAVLGILNLNIPPNGRREPTKSRGLLIDRLFAEPELLSADGDAPWLADRVDRLDIREMAPFRLVWAGLRMDAVRIARWDGLELTESRADLPACLASSGLGDEKVLPRLGLFDQMVGGDPSPAAQDAFHAHQWADRTEISVMMSREAARTESVISVDVEGPRTGGAGGSPARVRPEFTAIPLPAAAHGRG